MTSSGCEYRRLRAMIRRLAHVCIGATDLAETERFYLDLLGLEKAFDFIRAGQQIGFYLKAGDSTFIEVFVENAGPRARAAAHQALLPGSRKS